MRRLIEKLTPRAHTVSGRAARMASELATILGMPIGPSLEVLRQLEVLASFIAIADNIKTEATAIPFA